MKKLIAVDKLFYLDMFTSMAFDAPEVKQNSQN